MRAYQWLSGCIVLCWAVVGVGSPVQGPPPSPYRLADTIVVSAPDASPIVRLAASEIRGYIYRLTGIWPQTASTPLRDKTCIILRTGLDEELRVLPRGGPDETQNFALYPHRIGSTHQVVHGMSDRATLWAAYTLIETWGAGFYLGGDAIPPTDRDLQVRYAFGMFMPVFKIRGNLPWYNFLNSPTTWNPQDYKTFLAQMAKQKANLINFHAYDHEPFCGYDINDEPFGQDKLLSTGAIMGGPLMTTISEFRWWSPPIMCTKDHIFGTSLFFERGEWGCEVGIDDGWTYAPGRAVRLQQKMLADALAYAKTLGIETCLGFEVSGDARDIANADGLRKRITHVLKTYPLDYLSIWQAEHLGLKGVEIKQEDNAADADELWKAFTYFPEKKHRAEGVRMARLIRFAYQVMKEVQPETRMVVSGWGGDEHMKFSDYYIGLDKVLPADIIFAALDNIDPRSADRVSNAYAKLSTGRVRWPIPWFESDAGHTRIDQTGPQTNVTAFESLLKDMADKGCEGALGIHWRTRNVEDVAGYLYRFGWDKNLTATKFFRQYARDQYGPADADYMAGVHLKLEEFGPQYVGARGTIECARKGFNWFSQRNDSPIINHGPNRAGNYPVPDRFPILDNIASELMNRGSQALADGRGHAAQQYHDLAMTIRWLVRRACVGMAIWGKDAPLETRLRAAEAAYEQGRIKDARRAATEVLADLEKLDFKSAIQALATTCRTRGELGMLTTANARYGRYYATFVKRIAYLLDEPLANSLGYGRWTGEEVQTVFMVPNHVPVGQNVLFDAVLLPKKATTFQIELKELGDTPGTTKKLEFERLGGAYYRATFSPSGNGTWAWQLLRNGKPLDHSLGTSRGVVSVD